MKSRRVAPEEFNLICRTHAVSVYMYFFLQWTIDKYETIKK